MDYKEEYQKALERAKKGLPIDEVFPELKESEDERIRKFLVKHVSEWIGCIEHDLRISPKDVESEEELAMFKDGLAYLEKQKEAQPGDKDRYMEGYMNGMNDALKEQKPAEWSEEDWKLLDEMREHLIHVMGNRPDITRNKIYEGFINLVDKLKSLHPQPHWKPSEEQMKFLKRVVNGYDITCRGQVALESLYNDLKKL